MWANPSGRSLKTSDVSELLRLLTKNEGMSKSLIFLSESLICSFFRKNKQFAQKTDEQIPSPGINCIRIRIKLLPDPQISCIRFNCIHINCIGINSIRIRVNWNRINCLLIRYNCIQINILRIQTNWIRIWKF